MMAKKILLSVFLLVAVPAMAKQAEWEKYRNQFLGLMRVKLMESCALGHKFNAAKLTYWEPKSNQRLEIMFSVKTLVAYTSGEAAAMKTACPNVW